VRQVAFKGSLKDYVESAISGVVKKNFKEEGEDKLFADTNYAFSGDIVSQRDIQRLVSMLLPNLKRVLVCVHVRACARAHAHFPPSVAHY
jgi:hypothetical protein